MNWTTYQLRADHNAVMTLPTLIDAWTFDTHARLNGGFAIGGDTVYANTFAPSVLALRIDDGTLKWQTAVDNVVMSTPILAEGEVFVGTGTNHHLSHTKWGRPEGDRVFALDAADGHVRWSFKTVGEDMPSPVYVQGRVIFANGDSHAYALDARSGKLLWRTGLNGISTMASATTDGRNVYLPTCTLQSFPGVTTVVDVRSGAVRWRTPYGNCDSSPTLAGNRVFLSGIRLRRSSFGYGYTANVAAVDAVSGRLRWTYETPDVGYSSTFVSSERAVAGTFAGGTYFQSIPTHDRLVAFDAATGRVRWSLRTLAPVKMSPVVHNGFLYAGDTSGCFYSIEARTGTLRRVTTFNAPFSTSPPVMVNNALLVAVGSTIRVLPLQGNLVSADMPQRPDHG